jgi:hypothetical protein
MTSIYNPQQIEADENTFVTALAFATGTGVLTATRNDGVEITQSLDGRYATENTYVSSASFDTSDGELTLTRTDAGTVVVDLDGRYSQTDVHLDSAAFNSGTRVLTLTLTDASTITVTIPEGADANDYVNASSFNTGDGVLTLTRTDGGTVTSDLDGRYVPYKYTVGVVTDLDDLVTTQVQVCDKTAANIPTASSASMDNFSVLVIQAGSGGSQLCIASDADSSDNQAWIRMWKDNAGSYTFTDWAEFSTSTTGNFVPFDLVIPSPSYNLNDYTTTGIFSVDNNAKNLPSDMPSWSDECVLQVYKSGSDNGTQLLYTAAGTTSVQIGRIYFRMWTDYSGVTWSTWRKVATENEYMQLHLVEPAYFNGDVNSLTDSGIYTVNSSSSNLPSPIHTNAITIEVIRVFQSASTGALGIRQICRQNIYSSTSEDIKQNLTYERSYNSAGTWGKWRLVTTGGIPGDLESSYAAVDVTDDPYESMTGIWGLGAKGAATTWPDDLPATSDYNILETILTGTSGAGQQKIMCADYDSGTDPDTHIREWKRVFDSSSTTDWYEYQFQGQPIYKEVIHTTLYVSATHGNNPDTSKTAAYYVTLGGNSMYLYGFSGGYAEGQTMRVFRETNTLTVEVVIYNNSYYATQPIYLMNGGTSLTLSDYESAEFIYHNNIWFQYK